MEMLNAVSGLFYLFNNRYKGVLNGAGGVRGVAGAGSGVASFPSKKI
jgi:hypothetical protein